MRAATDRASTERASVVVPPPTVTPASEPRGPEQETAACRLASTTCRSTRSLDLGGSLDRRPAQQHCWPASSQATRRLPSRLLEDAGCCDAVAPAQLSLPRNGARATIDSTEQGRAPVARRRQRRALLGSAAPALVRRRPATLLAAHRAGYSLLLRACPIPTDGRRSATGPAPRPLDSEHQPATERRRDPAPGAGRWTCRRRCSHAPGRAGRAEKKSSECRRRRRVPAARVSDDDECPQLG